MANAITEVAFRNLNYLVLNESAQEMATLKNVDKFVYVMNNCNLIV